MKSKQESIHKLAVGAYHYLHFRARTVYEMRTHLTKKTQKYPEALPYIEEVIADLIEQKYLNDTNFIKEFVRSRTNNKPQSKFLLSRELITKGVSQEDIDEYFNANQLDEHELATKALTKITGRWNNLPPLKKKKKIYDYLARRGFSFDIIRVVYEEDSSS
ncbi:MAG: regulatory protein RecX [bacterium]|nr:regulatory protein RecX [bacterium]